MGVNRDQIDVDELMKQIRNDVANRPLAVIPQPSPSNRVSIQASPDTADQVPIQAPVRSIPQPSLWKRVKGKSKHYLLKIARRAKQVASRVRRKLKAKLMPTKTVAPLTIETPTHSSANPRSSTVHIAILTPCLIDGDAVGNDVIGMYRVLEKQGYACTIFAEAWVTSEVDVKHISELRTFLTRPSDVLIYHYSIGWDLGLAPLQELDCKKVIKYHNVTPPEYYEDFNEDYANVCRAGRAQLQSIANIQQATYLSDSAYNASELHQLGVSVQNSAVLPPFHYIDQLQFTEPDFSVLDTYRDGKFNILMVGRLVPNKGHAALIEAFYVYHQTYNPNSRLLIVGKSDPRLNQYNDFLQQKVANLGLTHSVVFTGGVSAAALKAYYLVSNAFMITSDHEGFCVPLIEAMSIKLPIVAYGSTAIPMTVGKAGVVWSQPDPALLAGALDRIATNPTISRELGELGWQRYQEVFTNRRIETEFLELIQRLTAEAKEEVK